MGRLVAALDAATTAPQQQQSAAATQSPTGAATAAGSTGATGSGTTTTPSQGAAGGSGSRSTASLEVAVLEAAQQLASAEPHLDAAVLEAPITGRVAQEVGVTPAGTTGGAAGLVQSIGVLPTSTTSSTPTYPVQVTVTDAPVTPAAGSTATATITLATASDVLTVPVSAVTGLSAGAGTVQVLSSGTVKATPVTVGAVGQGKVHVTAAWPPARSSCWPTPRRRSPPATAPSVDRPRGASAASPGPAAPVEGSAAHPRAEREPPTCPSRRPRRRREGPGPDPRRC